MRRRWALAALLAALVTAAPASAHHTGLYTPKDNAITTNFKEVKFSVQARKFDVALRRFDEGPLRAEMRARADILPAGLEARTRAAMIRLLSRVSIQATRKRVPLEAEAGALG